MSGRRVIVGGSAPAMLSLLMGMGLRKIAEDAPAIERTASAAQDSAPEPPPLPIYESRQVRRARERRVAKAARP